MIKRYTLEELIRERKLRKGLLPLSTGDYSVRIGESSTPDEVIGSQIRSWYDGLLRTAEAGEVGVFNLAEEIEEISRPEDNMLQLRLPERGVRLIEVELQDWGKGVSVFHAPGSAYERRQSDRWLRSTPESPGAVLQGRELRIYGLQPLQASRRTRVAADLKARVRRLMMTAQPEDGSFLLAPYLLE